MTCDCPEEFERVVTIRSIDPVTFRDVIEKIVVCGNCGCELGPKQ